MSEQVISFVADESYLPHAKSVMVNCRRQGGWQGDFCLISPGDCDTSDIERRRIHVLHVADASWDFLVKFHAFTPYFRRWQQALCLDLDIMVQGPLQRVFGVAQRLSGIGDEDVKELAGELQANPLEGSPSV